MAIRLKSLKPYLFNAYYNWIIENEMTPHILVNATYKGVIVPEGYVTDGSIILSLLPSSIDSFHASSNAISFKARFAGKSEDIYVPYSAIEQLIAVEAQAALPIGRALEQLDLAPEDEIYPDEGIVKDGPEFEIDTKGSEETSQKSNEKDPQTDKGKEPGFEFV
ncbi:MAG: hypothetical protein II291_04210 [Succinivibrio sp.]|nr:hypothetical protein [Succinivibrio sp.]